MSNMHVLSIAAAEKEISFFHEKKKKAVLKENQQKSCTYTYIHCNNYGVRIFATLNNNKNYKIINWR